MSTDAHKTFADHYRVWLQGRMYVPLGLLLVLAVPLGLYLPPGAPLFSSPVLLVAGCILATAPWMWYRHTQYMAGWACKDPEGPSPIRSFFDAVTPLVFAPLMILLLAWIAVVTLYVPAHSGIEDAPFLVWYTGTFLYLGTMAAPDAQLRRVYGIGTLALVGASLLPLLLPASPRFVTTVMYVALGLVIAGVGEFNHRLFLRVYGPRGASPQTPPETSSPSSPDASDDRPEANATAA